MVPVAWFALLIPVLFTIIRFAGGVVGLTDYFYWLIVAWVFIVAQIAVAAFIRRRARRTNLSAAGTLTTIFMLLAITFHLMIALTADNGNYGTTDPSIVESLLGVGKSTVRDLENLSAVGWLVSYAAAIVAAWYESRWSVLRKQEARQNRNG